MKWTELLGRRIVSVQEDVEDTVDMNDATAVELTLEVSQAGSEGSEASLQKVYLVACEDECITKLMNETEFDEAYPDLIEEEEEEDNDEIDINIDQDAEDLRADSVENAIQLIVSVGGRVSDTTKIIECESDSPEVMDAIDFLVDSHHYIFGTPEADDSPLRDRSANE